MNNDKREHREMKREVKRAGHKHNRNQVKRVLTERPDEAAELGDDFGRHSTAELNGIDHDATRRRPGRPAVREESQARSDPRYAE